MKTFYTKYDNGEKNQSLIRYVLNNTVKIQQIFTRQKDSNAETFNSNNSRKQC